MTLTALVVDDEKPARDRLKRLLGKYEDVKVLDEAANGLEALEKIEALQPDVVFLDIEMPELNGLGVAEAVRSPQAPSIVFITAYSQHALKAFDVSALDYLVKPIVEARLEAAIARLRQLRSRSARDYAKLAETLAPDRKLAIRCGAKFSVFDPSKISAILAQDHYAALVVEDREFIADDSIDALMERLSPKQFYRVHRSAAINLEFLKELEREGDRKYLAVLKDKKKTKVPIARERLPDLKKRLGID